MSRILLKEVIQALAANKGEVALQQPIRNDPLLKALEALEAVEGLKDEQGEFTF